MADTSYAAGPAAPGIPARPVQRNIRPGARGTDRARTAEATAPRARFTSRMAILVLVLAVLMVSYASSMRAYLQQRSHINDLRAQIASSERDIERARAREAPLGRRRVRRDAGTGAVRLGDAGRDELPGARPRREAARAQRTSSPIPAPWHAACPTAWWAKVYGSLEVADHPQEGADPGDADHAVADAHSRRPTSDPCRRRRRGRGRRPARPAAAVDPRGRRTGARAATPTWSPPSRGSTTARRSRRPST